MQVGRGLGKSLVKPPAQSRELRAQSKPLGRETAQPLKATSSVVWLSSRWKFLLTTRLNNSVFSLCPLPLVLLSYITLTSLALSPWYPPHTYWRAVVSSAHSPSYWKPSLLPAKQAHSKPLFMGQLLQCWLPWWPSSEVTALHRCLSCIAGTRTGHGIPDVI